MILKTVVINYNFNFKLKIVVGDYDFNLPITDYGFDDMAKKVNLGILFLKKIILGQSSKTDGKLVICSTISDSPSSWRAPVPLMQSSPPHCVALRNVR